LGCKNYFLRSFYTAYFNSAVDTPVALGSAIGLERLAPLGAVAIGGLIIGTFLTLLFIPLIYIWTVKEGDAKDLAAV